VVAYLGGFANMLLVDASTRSNKWTFVQIVSTSLGPFGEAVLEVGLLGLTLGLLSAFLLQIGDTGSDIINSGVTGSPWWSDAVFVKLFVMVFTLIPLSTLRNLSALSNVSLCGLIIVGYLLAVVCFVSPNAGGDDGDGSHEKKVIKFAFWGEYLFVSLPIVILGFGNSINLQEVLTELENPTRARIKQLVYGTNFIVAFIYAVIGVAGYLRFGGEANVDIFSNYVNLTGNSLTILTVALVAVVFVDICTYPLLLFPCRACLHSVLSHCLPKEWLPTKLLFFCETILIFAATFTISEVVPALDIILGFTGAVAGILLAFTFPALTFAQLFPEGKAVGWGMALFSALLGVVCLTAQIMITSE